MELTFEHTQKICDGHNPAGYHTPDNYFQVLGRDEPDIIATRCHTPMGHFDSREFIAVYPVAEETGAGGLRATYLPRINLFAHWWQEAPPDKRHRLALMVLKQDVSKLLNDGKIAFREDDPGSSLSLTLENPDGIIAQENFAAVGPGARVSVWFSMGDSSRIQIGDFYIDRIAMARGKPLVTIEARSVIGKLLKDQTFDEKFHRLSWSAQQFFSEILDDAGVRNYSVEDATHPSIYRFDRQKTFYEGMKEALMQFIGWRIRERPDGTVVIGSQSYAMFTEGPFAFHRDQDCFSREVIRDDQEAVSRICVWKYERWSEIQNWLTFEKENIGTGDGLEDEFRTGHNPVRTADMEPIIYLDDVEEPSANYSLNTTTGLVTFTAAPGAGVAITISYEASIKEVAFEGPFSGTDGDWWKHDCAYRPYDQDTVRVYHSIGGRMDELDPPVLSGGVWTGQYLLEGMNSGELPPEMEPGPNQIGEGNVPMANKTGEWHVSYRTEGEPEVIQQEEKHYYYRDVNFLPGWNMPRQKTAYVQIPDNTPEAEAEALADELAEIYGQIGQTETFLSTFRPHLQPGDTAWITEPGRLARDIGMVTQVEHSFGKGGFYTQFTIDSGGRYGKPPLKRYMETIAAQLLKPKGEYTAIDLY